MTLAQGKAQAWLEVPAVVQSAQVIREEAQPPSRFHDSGVILGFSRSGGSWMFLDLLGVQTLHGDSA